MTKPVFDSQTIHAIIEALRNIVGADFVFVDEENKDKEIYEFNQLVQEKQKTSIDYFEQVVHLNELLEEKHKLLIEKEQQVRKLNENIIKLQNDKAFEL